MKKMTSLVAVIMSTVVALAATVTVDTPEFALSIKHDGVRESDGNGPLV